MTPIKLWHYKHYKWNLYQVIGEALHTETWETMVIYRWLYDVPELWFWALFVRPKEMFLENVEVNGKIIPRFTFQEK